jgi:O-succinylhomoserine sulfhydrylase
MDMGRGQFPRPLAGWKPRTRAVHAGTRRSQYGEVSEALFLTQGFVYDSAEAAEARFIEAGPDEFIYARYGNPTVRMFEDRIAALEGAEDAFATASGMAAVNGALMSMLKAGDHVVRRARFSAPASTSSRRSCRATASRSFRRRHRSGRQWRAAIRPDTKARVLRVDVEPDAGGDRHRRVAALAHAAGAEGRRRQRLCHAGLFSARSELGADVVIYSATKHIDGQGRCLGGVILGHARLHPQDGRALHEAHRRRDEPVQRLGDAERGWNDGPALPRAGRQRRRPWPRRWRGMPSSPA